MKPIRTNTNRETRKGNNNNKAFQSLRVFRVHII
uniref:Uncharacterized protein n=1 Tax=Arundo donax TaxID=35708 RepID=A0A0A9EGS2_ARUDO